MCSHRTKLSTFRHAHIKNKRKSIKNMPRPRRNLPHTRQKCWKYNREWGKADNYNTVNRIVRPARFHWRVYSFVGNLQVQHRKSTYKCFYFIIFFNNVNIFVFKIWYLLNFLIACIIFMQNRLKFSLFCNHTEETFQRTTCHEKSHNITFIQCRKANARLLFNHLLDKGVQLGI